MRSLGITSELHTFEIKHMETRKRSLCQHKENQNPSTARVTFPPQDTKPANFPVGSVLKVWDQISSTLCFGKTLDP